MDFGKKAKESAQTYYEYLKAMHKGEINYEVLSKKPTSYGDVDGYFELILGGPKVTQPDYLQIQVDNICCDSSCIEIVAYTEHTNTLLIKPIGDMYKKIELIHPNQIKIYADLKFLVKRVETWYEEHGFKVALPVAYPSIIFDKDNSLIVGASTAQIEAMEGVLSNPFTYVWGAPGTGKTQFVLARLVGMYVEKGKKVLITAPTNNSVEQTLRGVLPVLRAAGIEIEDAVLRLGVPSDRFAKEFPEICESSRRARVIRKMQEQMTQVREKIERNNELLQLYHNNETSIAELGVMERYLSLVEDKNAFLVGYISQINMLSNTIELQLNQKQNLDDKKKQLEDDIDKNKVKLGGLYVARDKYRTGLWSVFAKKKLGLTEQAIEESLDDGTRLRQELELLMDQIEALQIEISNQNKVANSLTNDVRSALREIKERCAILGEVDEIVRRMSVTNYIEESELLIGKLRELVKEKRTEVEDFDIKKTEEDIKTDISSLTRVLESLTLQLKEVSLDTDNRIEKCQVVAATIDTCLARVIPDMPMHFNHVFLDEAGYSCTIKAATLLAFDCPVTFLGDHMQLPPVCEMNDDKIQENEYKSVSFWAQSALYVENAINETVDDFAEQYLLAEDATFYFLRKYSLSQTFRFGPKLAAVLADNVYDASFIGSEKHDTHIYSIDACKGTNDEKRTSSGEAYAIVEYCRKHLDEDVAILTPYTNQANLIKRELSRNKLDAKRVYTIHGSQGREWETVLFSVVDTHDMWFVDSYNKKGRGKNLINTAVSRAKKKLVIVADKKYWLNREGQLIEKLIAVAESEK